MNIMKKVIGVTGQLAAGKTTVTDLFVSLGAVRIDADLIARAVLEEEEVKQLIMSSFGPGIMSSGKINRKMLAQRVFSDKDSLKVLCDIVHPLIINRIRRAVSEARSAVVVIDAPLLFETGLDREVDFTVVVKADTYICLKRAMMKGISEEMAQKIMANQMPPDEKILRADYVINNSGDFEKIKEGVEQVWQRM